jgi:hypothetical protein
MLLGWPVNLDIPDPDRSISPRRLLEALLPLKLNTREIHETVFNTVFVAFVSVEGGV